ncbi:hypothetical protein ACI8AF_25500 [Blastococcus sp. SYSU D00669]
MQYFGSKEGLFAAAMKGAHGGGTARTAPREEIPAAVLRDLLTKFEGTADREAAVTLLRNFLTHHEAKRIMRDEVMCAVIGDLSRTIGGPDAELKAALLMSCAAGMALGRYALELPGLADASPADVERLLQPALQALLGDAEQPRG